MNLALFDLDGTLIPGDSDHAFGEFMVALGWADADEHRRRNDAFYRQYQAGTLDIHEYIDFTTGAIYLPDGKYSVAPEQLKNAIGSDGRIDNHRLKAIIEHETGRQLPLLHPNLREQHGSVEQLATLGLRSAG